MARSSLEKCAAPAVPQSTTGKRTPNPLLRSSVLWRKEPGGPVFPFAGEPAPGRVPTRMASRARASEFPPLTKEQRSQRVKLTAPLTFPQWVRKTSS
jgi:hypothetical protein